jgi:hypothetical protein
VAPFVYRQRQKGIDLFLNTTAIESVGRLAQMTDLDDTVKEGIIGEVGHDSISWDLDHHTQMHGVYPQLLHAL